MLRSLPMRAASTSMRWLPGSPTSSSPATPHVFAAEDLPDDLDATWEARKRAEKGRTSALDGIPPLDPLARTMKVIRRTRALDVPVTLPHAPISAEAVGEGVVALVARAQASGIDADQAVRDAVRTLERRVAAAETGLPEP